MKINNAKPHTPCFYWVFGFSVIILYGHTNATLQIMGGVPLRAVAGRLGHAKTSTTADIYSHVIRSVDEAAAEILEDMLNPVKRKKLKVEE